MTETVTPKRPRGRPPKPEGESKDWSVSVRFTGNLQTSVREHAVSGGRSVSAEIERCVRETYEREQLETTLRRVLKDVFVTDVLMRDTGHGG